MALPYDQMLANVVDHGFVAVSMVIGRRTGLFDVLLKADTPLTSMELATKAGLKERYVREWLGCMATTGVVELEADRYHVARARRQDLQLHLHMLGYLSCSLERLQDIQHCFSKDGPPGKSFGSTPAIIELMSTEEEGQVDSNVSEFLQAVPGLKEQLESGIDVAEFGSNLGHVIMALAQRFPQSRFRGSDVDEGAVREAQERVRTLGLENASFHVVDLCRLPRDWEASFHWVFVRDVIHDLPQPQVGVEAMHQALKEGGLCSVIDINASTRHQDNVGKPWMGFSYTVSTFFCVPNALEQDPESPALGGLWGVEQARELWTKCGFKILHDCPCGFDSMLQHYVLQK